MKYFAAILLACFLSIPVKAATYTLNHAVCVNATATTNVQVKDCGDAPLLISNIGTTVQAYNVNLASVAANTYVGYTSIITLGTITTGVWHGTAIADTYIASSSTWNTKLDSSSALNATNLTSGTIPNARIASLPNANLANSSFTIAGHSISLGGSQTLSCADLSDCTSGTYSPVLSFGGASVGITYGGQQGEWRRISNMVCFQAWILLTNKGSSTGSAQFSTPVAVSQNTLQMQSVYNSQGMTFTGMLMARLDGTSSQNSNLFQNNNGTQAALTNSNFANNSDIGIQGCYFVN